MSILAALEGKTIEADAKCASCECIRTGDDQWVLLHRELTEGEQNALPTVICTNCQPHQPEKTA